MPCDDITDRLEIRVDDRDCLVSYSLTKLTCGSEVGNKSLLMPWVEGADTASICSHDHGVPTTDLPQKEAFLRDKHLASLQMGLRVLSGADSGHPGAACVVVSIGADEGRVDFVGHIESRIAAETVPGCATCGSGSAKPSSKSL